MMISIRIMLFLKIYELQFIDEVLKCLHTVRLKITIERAKHLLQEYNRNRLNRKKSDRKGQ